MNAPAIPSATQLPSAGLPLAWRRCRRPYCRGSYAFDVDPEELRCHLCGPRPEEALQPVALPAIAQLDHEQLDL